MLEALDRYGIAAVVIAAFLAGTAYTLRRLFNAKDGILTKVGERHVSFLDKSEEFQSELAESNRRLADAAETARQEMKTRNDQFGELVASRAALHRAGIHACDVLAKVADALSIDARDSIEAIRREIQGGVG